MLFIGIVIFLIVTLEVMFYGRVRLRWEGESCDYFGGKWIGCIDSFNILYFSLDSVI